MNRREQIQAEATSALIKANYHGIVNVAPRVGN